MAQPAHKRAAALVQQAMAPVIMLVAVLYLIQFVFGYKTYIHVPAYAERCDINDLNTGDVVFYSENSLGQVIVRAGQNSDTGHMGMVLRLADGRATIIEADPAPCYADCITGTSEPGVHVYDATDRVAGCRRPVAARRLVYRDKADASVVRQTLRDIALLNRKPMPYMYDPIHWARLLFYPRAWYNKEYWATNAAGEPTGKGMWCSWLVPYIYGKAGLLKTDKDAFAPHNYTPSALYDERINEALKPEIAQLGPPVEIAVSHTERRTAKRAPDSKLFRTMSSGALALACLACIGISWSARKVI